ncbi:hypothetical protein VTK73DRAFT_2985 [Phialemonium thermophilum]|uniref:Uncharacterized protein n=1 Tax=Phialemonium thermophilum TaxID=223376 RepID=A0ABR3Y1S3_9PEZI
MEKVLDYSLSRRNTLLRAASPSAYLLLGLLLVFFLNCAIADDGPDVVHIDDDRAPLPRTVSETPGTLITATPTATRIVSIFYIDERAFEGLPYTLFHRDSGSVIGVDKNAATYVITTTRGDQRPSPTHSRTDNITTGIPTLMSRPTWHYNGTGGPSTVTQGPSTFLYTGTRFGGPQHTIVNRCSLNGTVAAACNLTHVGSVWYTDDSGWNGTYSTYSYNWTSGDRFGFAPVTITKGAELLGPPEPTAASSTNAAAPAVWKRAQQQRNRHAATGSVGSDGRTAGRLGRLVPSYDWLEYGMGAMLPAVVLALALAL